MNMGNAVNLTDWISLSLTNVFDPKTDPNILYAVHKLTNVKIKKQRNIAIIVRLEYV